MRLADPSPRPSSPAGFTLVEVVVALFLVAIAALALAATATASVSLGVRAAHRDRALDELAAVADSLRALPCGALGAAAVGTPVGLVRWRRLPGDAVARLDVTLAPDPGWRVPVLREAVAVPCAP